MANDEQKLWHEQNNEIFDESYSSLMQTLQSSLNNQPVPNSSHNLPSITQGSSAESKQSLDNLLQHYQELLNRNRSQGSTPFSAATPPVRKSPGVLANEKPCDHCRRRQIKCINIPDCANCVQCETKGIKCTYSEAHSTVKRVADEDININDLLKRSRMQEKPMVFPRSSFYVGPTSVFDISLLGRGRLDKIDQAQLSRTTSMRKVSPSVQFILRDDITAEIVQKAERDCDNIERLVHPHGRRLVDLFFRYVHPSYPVLHEKVFLEKYARSHRELTAPLLAAVYYLGARWWDYGMPNPAVGPVAERPDIGALAELAQKSFQDAVERPKLSAVQAGLLLLQCRSESSHNWVLVSQVVALAEDLGLGLDCQDWKLPKWERGLRRRLAWAVWMQDKWTALSESRFSHLILGRNWLVKVLSNEDFPDTTDRELERGRLFFQYSVSLSIIMGDIMDTFYTLGAIQSTTRIEQVLRMAKPVQLSLREWYHSLPSELAIQSFQPRQLNSNCSLHLSYFATEITLHRKIISTLGPESPKELVDVCRGAARSRLVAAIDFVKDLKPEHLYAHWHSSSSSNFSLIGAFAALLYATSLSKEEADQYREYVRSYVWILKSISKDLDKAFSALHRLTMILTQIPELLQGENGSTPTMQNNYARNISNDMIQQLGSFQGMINSAVTPGSATFGYTRDSPVPSNDSPRNIVEKKSSTPGLSPLNQRTPAPISSKSTPHHEHQVSPGTQ